METKTLQELRASIEQEVPHIGKKQYSHNLIATFLKIIAERFGRNQANQVIEDFDLEKLGWSKEKAE